ncbi:hypothetical protein HPO96_02295 [Kribbella sandramycini]|uniref:DUF1700 domain-containing protein n=1 Tax=Kribbella sandramycini TaxID=60450 RepID=A0A7Y4KUQ8_9ACTN|nr:hypothetical protein [Kribbella sandramycini]MBB6568340.1 hypothetical protein [Kribbella sandramycini]NOL39068.1 hypothetical protein [Kribbella sandramycini]
MSADQLVDAYLDYLTKAAEPLPAERRTDLIADVTSHIAEARAAGATTESDVRQMLQQLGDPDDIVAAATDGLVLVERPKPQPRLGGREILTLILLPFGAYIFFVGWVVGVVLLWMSDRWTRNEKLLGTLVTPLGYASVQAFATVDGDVLQLPQAVTMLIAIVLLVAPLCTFVVLVSRGRPGRSAQ